MRREHRVHRLEEVLLSLLHHRSRDAVADDLFERCLTTGAHVEHAATRDVPALAPRELGVGAILEREIGAVVRQDVNVARGRRVRLLGGLVAGGEEAVVGVLGRVPIGEVGDGGVLEDDGRVARHEVASEDALPDDDRVVVRAVVVSHVDLVELPAEARDLDGRPPHPHPLRPAPHPEGGVPRQHQELRLHRRHAIGPAAEENGREEQGVEEGAGHGMNIRDEGSGKREARAHQRDQERCRWGGASPFPLPAYLPLPFPPLDRFPQ